MLSLAFGVSSADGASWRRENDSGCTLASEQGS